MIRAVLLAACLVAATGDSLQQGQSALKAGHADEAIAAFTRVLVQEPNSAAAYLGRGKAYLAAGRASSAADDFYAVTLLDSTNIDARFLLGQANEKQGDFPRALVNYKEALRLKPGYPGAQDGIGRVQKQADVANALVMGVDKQLLGDAISTSSESPEKALEKYSQAIAINPNLTAAYVGRAMIYEHGLQFDKSVPDWSKVIELAPRYATGYLQRANDLRGQKKYKEALADATRSIGLNPEAKEAWYNRAFIYFVMQDDDKAISDFSQVIKPDDAITAAARKASPDTNEDTLGLVIARQAPMRANYYRGLLWFRKGIYAQAQADFETSLKDDTQSAGSMMCLARLHALQGDHEKEKEIYQRLEEMVKPHPEMANDVAWFMSISPIADVHDPARALEIAKIACDGTQWKDYEFVDTYAAACADGGDFDGAIKWEKTYIDNGHPNAQNLADAQERLKLYQAHKPYRSDDML